MLGVLAGGALAARQGFEAVFAVAAGLGVLATACAWRMRGLEQPAP